MSKDFRTNNKITASQVRLIDGEKQIGIISLREAMDIAREKELDLVEVSPNADPPVCKILDYGKYKYHQSKVEHKQKTKQKQNRVKEVRLSPRISDHDLETKAQQAKGFLAKGMRVKVNVVFRGREIAYIDLGKEQVEQFRDIISEVAELDGDISRQGYTLSALFKPIQKR